MKNSKFKIQNRGFIFFILFFVFCLVPAAISAQSTDQNFPTPVVTNEISGTIRARDLGDSRLTSFFYVFNGSQGDVFINVVTKNFDGDIDIFTAGSLRPLTKIKSYSDNPDSETGRIVYLRQPERLILRVEGRTPNDEPATFRIKFAGSFQPITGVAAETETPNLPQVTGDNQTDVRVNSVGTIIEVKPKPTPQPKEEKTETIAQNKEEKPKETAAKKEIDKEKKSEVKPKDTTTTASKKKEKPVKKEQQEETEKPKPVVVVTDNATKDEEKAEQTKEEETKKEEVAENKESKTTKKSKEKVAEESNPLASINLVVVFKDGTRIEKPMSEVLRVNVDKGILTIVQKDGKIGRFSILEVAEMTIK